MMQLRNGYHVDFRCIEGSAFFCTIPFLARSLSRVFRFGAQTDELLSVAQHSVLVSELVDADNVETKRAALLHDASEAILGDVTTGLKRMLPEYLDLESRLSKAIFDTFGLPYPYPEAVKEADLRALTIERMSILSIPHWPAIWDGTPEDDGQRLGQVLSPDAAEELFLHRARQLGLW